MGASKFEKRELMHMLEATQMIVKRWRALSLRIQGNQYIMQDIIKEQNAIIKEADKFCADLVEDNRGLREKINKLTQPISQ